VSTRGFLGFVIDGQEKIAYNHSDSYPSGLGVDVLAWLRVAASEGTEHVAERARALRPAEGEPTDEDIEHLAPYANYGVGRQGPRPEWYQLLRETQGNPSNILAAGVFEDASGFPLDSLFAEYGYLVDLDRGLFEAYRGFQSSPPTKGRFVGREPRDPDGGYHPCALVAEWKLAELPSDEDFLAALDDEED
jgi:hypothetical protein